MGWVSNGLACGQSRLSRQSRFTEGQTPTPSGARNTPSAGSQRSGLFQRCRHQLRRVARQCWPADPGSPAEPRCFGQSGAETPDSGNQCYGSSGERLLAGDGGGNAVKASAPSDRDGTSAGGAAEGAEGAAAAAGLSKQHRRSDSRKSVDWSLTPCNSVADFADLEMVGRGRWATVYAATHCRSGRRVVLKIYTARHHSASMQKQIEREIWCMRQARGHMHAIGYLGSFAEDSGKIESAVAGNGRAGSVGKGANPSAHGVFRKSGKKSGGKGGGKSGRGSVGAGGRPGKHRRKQAVIVEEFAAGGDVYQRLMNEFCGQMPEAVTVREIMSPLLQVLRFLHANAIIHRDVKPENILFAADGQLKLADFGLAICTMRDLPGARVGTLDYMAPELLQAIPSASVSASANAGGSTAEPAKSPADGSTRRISKKRSIARLSSGKNWSLGAGKRERGKSHVETGEGVRGAAMGDECQLRREDAAPSMPLGMDRPIVCQDEAYSIALPYDEKVDVWACGILAYELQMGRPPFEVPGRQATCKNIMTCPLDTLPGFKPTTECATEFSEAGSSSSGGKHKVSGRPVLSPLCISFLKRALDRNPQTRASTRELLHHPWILSFAQSPSAMSSATPSPPSTTTTTIISSSLSSSSSSSTFPSSSSSAPSSRSSLSSPSASLNPPLPSTLPPNSSQHPLQSHPHSANPSTPLIPPPPSPADFADRPWVRFAPPPLRGVEAAESPRKGSGFNGGEGAELGAAGVAKLHQQQQQQQRQQQQQQYQRYLQQQQQLKAQQQKQQQQPHQQVLAWVNSFFLPPPDTITTITTATTFPSSSSSSACPPNCSRHFACLQALSKRRNSSRSRGSPFQRRGSSNTWGSGLRGASIAGSCITGASSSSSFDGLFTSRAVSVASISVLALVIALLGILLQVTVSLSAPRWPMVVTQVLGGPVIFEATSNAVAPENIVAPGRVFSRGSSGTSGSSGGSGGGGDGSGTDAGVGGGDAARATTSEELLKRSRILQEGGVFDAAAVDNVCAPTAERKSLSLAAMSACF